MICLLPAIEVTDNALCTAEWGYSGEWHNSTSLDSLQMIVTEFESLYLMLNWVFQNFYPGSFLSVKGT